MEKWRVRNELSNLTKTKKNVWGNTYKSLNSREASYKLKYVINNYFDSIVVDLNKHNYPDKTIRIIELGMHANELIDMIKGWLVV